MSLIETGHLSTLAVISNMVLRIYFDVSALISILTFYK